VQLLPGAARGLTAMVWIPESSLAAKANEAVSRLERHGASAGSDVRVWSPATSGDATTAELLHAGSTPIYEATVSRLLGPTGRATRESWADEGWEWPAGESAAGSADSGFAAGGLPRRTPKVSTASGSFDRLPSSAGEQPQPAAPMTADQARAYLSGFQRGARRAEHDLRPKPAGPTDKPVGS
jgi:hypothetical protein